jgi:superfamily II DNA or RNA helicase/diadenosine tetraphosphate (Ap4A) HIT family hydrolase/HKD family nuclease/SOS-response transcriptional repressor LexA
MTSPFQDVSPSEWIASNSDTFAIFDRFPVSAGHSLVITKRIVPTWFEATSHEQRALMELVNVVKARLDQLDPKPDGYNVGFNSGDAAGQTVQHLHIHVIPRYFGDVKDPRGGIRHVIPNKANYLEPAPARPNAGHDPVDLTLSTGHPDSPLWDHLSWRIAGASIVDVLASFVQMSGLDVIENHLFEAIRNRACVRILVSDYLYISDAHALRRLLGWTDLALEELGAGRLFVRLIELAKIPSAPISFHPKAWRIVDGQTGFITVGSSNLSKPALKTGVEWNLLSSMNAAPEAHAQVAAEFDALWKIASSLTPAIVEQYSVRASKFRNENFTPESIDSREPQIGPRPWQKKALDSLQRIRSAEYSRALVAVATGMGKTWLAALDALQVGASLRRRPRVLVIAHRAHILAQAESAVSQVLDTEFGVGTTAWYVGNCNSLGGDLVVASVQKLSRPEGLERIAQEQFDYVIMDEVHHAHAPTYRRVLARIRGNFILGLTATPERTDGVDVASIFDDNLAYHATIGDGIAEESLVPFHYIGIKDTVDFRQIPWRNGRFDQAELEQRVVRSERLEKLWSTLEDHPAARTLVFCCSRRHAIVTRDWLRAKGMSSAAVFSGDGGDNHGESLQRLRLGELQTLCVVDMFNEGLDIPSVDRVVMLRPTESKVIFLQQLGRGLRASDGKTRLLVIDFVGNHRIFAQRIVHLLSLRSASVGWHSLKAWLDGKPPELPEGCLIDVNLDVKDMLRPFLPQGRSAGIEGYRAIRDDLGRRPTILEVFSRGFLPRTIVTAQGSWFPFVDAEGDLSDDERKVVEAFGDWLTVLETTNLNKSYKMVVLRVLLDEGMLFDGMDLSSLCAACRRYLQNHQVLRGDLEGERHAVDHTTATDRDWAKWWIKWPIDRWLDAQNGKRWFIRDEESFRLNIQCPDDLKSRFELLTEEIVDWRLAAYAKSRRLVEPATGELTFEARVSHAQGRPILFVPDKSKVPDRPVGVTSVQLPDGSTWVFKFVKVACNVAMPAGEATNQLGKLLQEWFGASAGLPGTNFTVRFETRNGKWHAQPVESRAVAVPQSTQSEPTSSIEIVSSVRPEAEYSTHVPVFDVSAAAGEWGPEGSVNPMGWVHVPNQKLRKGMFAANVIGHSMEPTIPSNSWCLFRPIPAGSREGRLILVQTSSHASPDDGGRYTVKRYHSEKSVSEDGWSHNAIELQPLNPDYPPIPISADNADDLRIIGEFVCVIESGD